MKASDKQESRAVRSGLFPTTHWSIVRAAQDDGNPESARVAVAELCGIYWSPVYLFVRAKGRSREDAEDITQGFFASLISRESFDGIRKEKGRLRSFLLVALKRFLINDYHKRSSRKRGGGVLPVSLEIEGVENRIASFDTATPEEAFERQWALTLLERTLEALRDEYEGSGKIALYEALKDTITGDGSHVPFSDIADKLGITTGAARVSAHRLRRRYREILHAGIECTIDESTTVEEEIRHLFGIFSAPPP